MKRYFYRALKDRKEVVTGFVEAENQEDAKTKITQMGFLPAGIYSEDKIPKDIKLPSKTFIKKLGLKELMFFTSEFQMLVDSGISVFEALESLSRHAPSRKISIFADDLLKKMKGGRTLSEAIEDYTSILGTVYISLVRTGEESGTLPETLKYLTKLLKKQDELKGKMIHILIYPIILITIMTIMFFAFGGIIFPKMIQQLSMTPDTLPATVKMLIGSVNFIVKYGVFFILGILGFCYATGSTIGFERIRKQALEIMMKIPVLKDCLQYIALSHYMSVLHVAYDAGVPMLKTLSLAEGSIYIDSLKYQANLVTRSVEKGNSLTDSFANTYLLPSIMLSMVSTGEKTGKLGDMFRDIARNIEEKLDSAITALSKAFEPILLIVLGIGAAYMAISILQMTMSAVTSVF